VVSLSFFFYFLVLLFGIIGAMRGWAKELLVSFSVILALALLVALEEHVPVYPFHGENMDLNVLKAEFWTRTLVLTLLVFFGYQTPNLPRIPAGRFVRERLQDTLLGLVLGAINGYLIIGTLWSFMDTAGYPLQPFITGPNPDDNLGRVAINLLRWLPPVWLKVPYVYFAVIISFMFVLIVFL
jgi:hypothetical protein